MERFFRPCFQYFDFWLLGTTLLFAFSGIAMMNSATACITGEPLDWQSPALRQALYLAVGMVGMFVAAYIDYRMCESLRWIIWGGTLVLLAIVAVIGQATHGVTRWIQASHQNRN